MSEGLDGVVAARTVLSDVDGEAGRLVIAGARLDQLAGARFESVLARLHGGVGGLGGDVGARLGAARQRCFALLADFAPTGQDLVSSLRALMARLPDDETENTLFALVAAPAVFTPALVRLARGEAPFPPDPRRGHAADMLAMLTGAAPSEPMEKALDAYLVTVIDHGMNASTFAARVIASTRAGYGSAVLGAIGALKGPLHGGAPGPVLDMLDAVGTPDRAATVLGAMLDRGERLMGFGHRIYRVRDPRADALKAVLSTLGDTAGARLALASEVERVALDLLSRHKPGRRLETNVEFSTALLLEALGFERESFTCVFAAGRIGGWLAHAREQIATGKLIRPQSIYTGPPVVTVGDQS